jgi:hypothetical protein
MPRPDGLQLPARRWREGFRSETTYCAAVQRAGQTEASVRPVRWVMLLIVLMALVVLIVSRPGQPQPRSRGQAMPRASIPDRANRTATYSVAHGSVIADDEAECGGAPRRRSCFGWSAQARELVARTIRHHDHHRAADLRPDPSCRGTRHHVQRLALRSHLGQRQLPGQLGLPHKGSSHLEHLDVAHARGRLRRHHEVEQWVEWCQHHAARWRVHHHHLRAR